MRLASAPGKGTTIVVAERLSPGRHCHRVREHHDTVLIVRLLGAMKLALTAAGQILSAVGGR